MVYLADVGTQSEGNVLAPSNGNDLRKKNIGERQNRISASGRESSIVGQTSPPQSHYTESIRRLEFQDRLDILLEIRLSSVAE